MLQIVGGMYFRKGLKLYETIHRVPLFTNINFHNIERIDLPFGYLIPGTGRGLVRSVMVHVTERLEAEDETGRPSFLMSTSGDALIEDIAVVLSFALNACFTPSFTTASRVLRPATGSTFDLTCADILPGTFLPRDIVAKNETFDSLRLFITRLLALTRGVYERAMRTMRRIVTANEQVAENPTQAYIDYVAALERLSNGFEGEAPAWERLDARKRKILKPALSRLEPADQVNVRAAILKAEWAGIKYQYTEFILSHTRPSFFRSEATEVIRPVPRTALRRTVGRSYDARSQGVHQLQELAIGTWLLVGGAETATPPGGELMLTHSGLNRLTRHVMDAYIERGATDLDTEFRYRQHLPGRIKVNLAPSMFLANPDMLSPAVAADRASQYIAHLIEVISGRQEHPLDMTAVLEKIESLLPGQQKPAARIPLLTIYLLWHELFPPQNHRPAPEKLMTAARKELGPPSCLSFAVALLLDVTPSWSVDEWCDLAEDRHNELQTNKPFELPARLDPALWIMVAQSLYLEGAFAECRAALGHAVENVPGDEALMALESATNLDAVFTFDVREYVLGAPSSANTPGASSGAANPGT